MNKCFQERAKNALQLNITLTWIWGFDYTEMSSDVKQFVFSPQICTAWDTLQQKAVMYRSFEVYH